MHVLSVDHFKSLPVKYISNKYLTIQEEQEKKNRMGFNRKTDNLTITLLCPSLLSGGSLLTSR